MLRPESLLASLGESHPHGRRRLDPRSFHRGGRPTPASDLLRARTGSSRGRTRTGWYTTVTGCNPRPRAPTEPGRPMPTRGGPSPMRSPSLVAKAISSGRRPARRTAAPAECYSHQRSWDVPDIGGEDRCTQRARGPSRNPGPAGARALPRPGGEAPHGGAKDSDLPRCQIDHGDTPCEKAGCRVLKHTRGIASQYTARACALGFEPPTY